MSQRGATAPSTSVSALPLGSERLVPTAANGSATATDQARWCKRRTRPCVACGRERSCRWSLDAWVCMAEECGSEWYPEHDPIQYGEPK